MEPATTSMAVRTSTKTATAHGSMAQGSTGAAVGSCIAGNEGDTAHRTNYEQLYAAYGGALRVLGEVWAGGASVPTLRHLRRRAVQLWALLVAGGTGGCVSLGARPPLGLPVH